MKKSQLITNKLNILEEYAVDQMFPFHQKIQEYRRKYSLSMIVGLIERFIIPSHDEGCMREYLLAELERMKILAVTSGEDADILKFSLNDDQIEVILEHLTYIIKVIKL